jgi:hypothetical protein
MPDALSKIQAGVDKARSKLAAQRLGGREHDVQVQPYAPGNAIAGTAGTWGTVSTLSPRPKVKIQAVMRLVDGGLVQIGDCEVSGISRTYTETQLRGTTTAPPNRWIIDGKTYSLADLKKRPTEWVAVLIRDP